MKSGLDDVCTRVFIGNSEVDLIFMAHSSVRKPRVAPAEDIEVRGIVI